MITKRKSIIALFVVILVSITLLFKVGVSAYAAEPVPNTLNEEITISLDENGNVTDILSSNGAKSGYYTFKRFTAGKFTATQGYSFNLGHACKLKLMWAGRYVDGSSGTMSFTLTGPNAYQEYSMPMDGTTRNIEFKGNWPTGTLPAGYYEILLFPDDVTKEYASAGSVYSLDY